MYETYWIWIIFIVPTKLIVKPCFILDVKFIRILAEGKIFSFAVLPTNEWIHCCSESKLVEYAEDQDAALLDDVVELQPGDIAISVTNIVGFFFPAWEPNLPGPIATGT